MMFKVWIIVTLVFAIIMGGAGIEPASSISRQWISPIGEEFGVPITSIPINITAQQQKLKEQNWKTFYSSEYRFSLDYPNYNGKTNITERVLSDGSTTISFLSPIMYFNINIYDNSQSNIDPQELAVFESQNLSEDETMLMGGVTSFMQDSITGYTFATENPIIKERYYFESTDLLYSFTIIWPSFEHEEIDRVIDSIKFFDSMRCHRF